MVVRRLLVAVVVLALLLIPGIGAAQTVERCFPETGNCISGRIREFWEQNGGLAVFGYPTAPQGEIQIEGKPLQAQNFERNRLELHPENQRPYDVLLGRLGVDRLAQQGRDWFAFPKSEQQGGCRFFGETGHNVCGAILAYWRANGLEFDGSGGKSEGESLALFGLPLSDEVRETIQGQEYTVQHFERARFELHPENQPPYNVLLGLLGNEIRDAGGPAGPPPSPTPGPPAPLPPSFNNCQADPNGPAAPHYPVKIVGVDKRGETVTLQNVSPDAIDLSGWRMCSITGNQEHPIGGPIGPGETRIFPGPEGTIWNNGESDPGALYDSEGRLVSYWND